jgi:hypothetical protein
VTFRREIVSLLTVMAAALSVVAMFPFEAVAFKAVEPANTGATASFVVLSDEAESAALKTAKTSWQADRRALRSLRIDLAELELPEEKFEAVAMPGAFVSSAEFGIVDFGAPGYLPSAAAAPPQTIAPEPEKRKEAFSRQELLNIEALDRKDTL